LGKKFRDLRTLDFKRIIQFLLLPLNLRIVKRERSDPREKIS
jgi:hypothetical protein